MYKLFNQWVGDVALPKIRLLSRIMTEKMEYFNVRSTPDLQIEDKEALKIDDFVPSKKSEPLMYICTNDFTHRFNQNTPDGFCPKKSCHGKGYLVRDRKLWKCKQCGKLNADIHKDCEYCSTERLYQYSEVNELQHEIAELKKHHPQVFGYQKEIELEQKQTEIETLRQENEVIKKHFRFLELLFIVMIVIIKILGK